MCGTNFWKLAPLLLYILALGARAQEPCTPHRQSAVPGSGVRLQAPGRGTTQWGFGNGTIARTEPGAVLHTANSSYRGRINGTADGSLLLWDLRESDSGPYTATTNLSTGHLVCHTIELRIDFNLGTHDIGFIFLPETPGSCKGILTCSVRRTEAQSLTLRTSCAHGLEFPRRGEHQVSTYVHDQDCTYECEASSRWNTAVSRYTPPPCKPTYGPKALYATALGALFCLLIMAVACCWICWILHEKPKGRTRRGVPRSPPRSSRDCPRNKRQPAKTAPPLCSRSENTLTPPVWATSIPSWP
ncbi:ORF5 [Ranid herpesvirus 1]|uniref:ORF5 n=1 Tax=Ranid herpesvirus 1 TaxID=85655 RepID=Q14VV3_9VIRU|nr:ORF5 [Ranid herpesvirus 1]ABG25810.1 ORF5 [Ranid herpesvirus 1]